MQAICPYLSNTMHRHMAAIPTSQTNAGRGRSRNASTRIDMTPMVDLGFLLITFFILKTMLDKPVALQLNVPQHPPKAALYEPVKASHTMTVFLEKNDQVRYIVGKVANQNPVFRSIPMGYAFRRALLEASQHVPDDQLVVIIKPTAESTYKTLVDALDELAIAKIRRYALVDDLTPDEKALR